MQKITLEQMQTRKKQRRGSSYFWAVYTDVHSAPSSFKKLNSYENENHNVHIQKISSTLIVEIRIILAPYQNS